MHRRQRTFLLTRQHVAMCTCLHAGMPLSSQRRANARHRLHAAMRPSASRTIRAPAISEGTPTSPQKCATACPHASLPAIEGRQPGLEGASLAVQACAPSFPDLPSLTTGWPDYCHHMSHRSFPPAIHLRDLKRHPSACRRRGDARCLAKIKSLNPCMDAPVRARGFCSVQARDRVRSCIRP